MEDGTYRDCSNCRMTPDCCSNFKNIDNPVISELEIKEIQEKLGIDNFYERQDNGTYTVNTNSEGECIFYLNKGCSIYKYRPADCRLFPYDIVKKDEHYYLVLYKVCCIDQELFSSPSEIRRIDSVVQSVIPWIEDFTKEENYEKMSYLPYKVLRRVK